jgi:hypothetical protein
MGDVAQPVSPEDRQEALFKALQIRLSMTVSEAWEFGNELGFYKGGEARMAKDDLNALCKMHRGRVRKVDGFWRHIHEPDSIRTQYKRWADNWVVTS